jgi:hypothetical protein
MKVVYTAGFDYFVCMHLHRTKYGVDAYSVAPRELPPAAYV